MDDAAAVLVPLLYALFFTFYLVVLAVDALARHVPPLLWLLPWVASAGLAFHPWHELAFGFRDAVNDRLIRVRRGSERAVLVRIRRDVPLGRPRAVLQTIGLSVARPAAVLLGPAWLLPALFAFTAADVGWTHGEKRIPGRWSAWVELVALLLAVLYRGEEIVAWLAASPPLHVLALFALEAAGVLALASFWWSLRRKVR